MALQKTVNTQYAEGVAGDPVNISLGQTAYTSINRLAEEDLTAGQFAFNGTNPYTQAKASGSTVAGFVVRVQQYANLDMSSEGTLTIAKGNGASIAVTGDFYATATGAATVGQKVLVNTSTGAMSYGDSAGEGTVDTGWVVSKAGSQGDLIVITKH